MKTKDLMRPWKWGTKKNSSMTSFTSLSCPQDSAGEEFGPTSIRSNGSEADALFFRLREQAIEVRKVEPYMKCLLERTILHPETDSFISAISRTIASRLISSCGGDPVICDKTVMNMIMEAMNSSETEYEHTMTDAVVQDILASMKRDPACETELEVVLFFKGFAALVCHRAARRHYNLPPANTDIEGSSKKQRFVSLWLQSQASAAFGVDIHPAGWFYYLSHIFYYILNVLVSLKKASLIDLKIYPLSVAICLLLSFTNLFLYMKYKAEIGVGTLFDHATGLVIGETAKVGHNCTILHGVTLGGTGKVGGDRHPKVGNDVLIGAGTSILGNIKIGDGAKIGAGSIVLKPIPHGSTAVGAPAKIIGWVKERRPGSVVDMTLSGVVSMGGDNDLSTTDESDDSSNRETNTTSSLALSERSISSDDIEKNDVQMKELKKYNDPPKHIIVNPQRCFRGQIQMHRE